MGNVYSFSPRFRPEDKESDKNKYLAEFWMIEAQLIFCDLLDLMECIEDFIKYTIHKSIEQSEMQIDFISEKGEKFKEYKETYGKTLKENLKEYSDVEFQKITYEDTIKLLIKAQDEGKKFKKKVLMGQNLSKEHSNFVTDIIFKKPTFIYNFPPELKSILAKENPDWKTVAAFDLYFPQIGKLATGLQNEEKLFDMKDKMDKKGLSQFDYRFYQDIRKYGPVPHGGFQIGFERLLMIISGQTNIRDLMPYARGNRHCPQ